MPENFMKSLLAASFIALSATTALAQTPAASTAPKPVATVPVRPAAPAATPPAKQTPADTAKALGQADRVALQTDLVWTGDYNGVVNGEITDRVIAAIKKFQKELGAKDTGVLNPQERAKLAAASKKAQDNVGWKVVTDMVTGARVGLPGKLLPQQTSDANGTRWSAPQGTIQVNLARRKEAGATLAAVAEREKKEPAGRKILYSAVRPDFVVLSGLQGLKKFYLRGQISGDEVRVLTVLYDQATEGTMEPVVIAMSNAFAAFPGAATAQAAPAPPPRKKVEYATGIVLSADGFILTDRQAIDGCQFVTIPQIGNADRVAEDKARDLALLRVYGAKGLKPLAISTDREKPDVTVIGIADPQLQGGGAAITSVPSRVGAENALSPAPAIGFSGGAVIDADGKFAGMAQLKPAVVAAAGTAPATPVATAVVVTPNIVREFASKHGVTASAANGDAKASVVRVICVRK
jgi:hypothetical protein